MNDLFGHGFAGEIIKAIAGAMRRDQDIGINVLERFNCLADVVVAEGRNDMEAADDCVHLVDAGHFLGPPYGVDHAAMAARGQDDETLTFDFRCSMCRTSCIVARQCGHAGASGSFLSVMDNVAPRVRVELF